MADFLQGLDPGKLVLGCAVLSAFLALFDSPTYNLPIFLFGSLVHEISDAAQSLSLFTGVVAASILFDIVWALNHNSSAWVTFLLLLLWLLKFPTAATFVLAHRQRGSQFMGLGADINGPTVWSMPGGFTSAGRDGYQVVDDEPRAAVPRGPPPPQKPTIIVAPTPQVAPGMQPGNYQSA